MGLLDSLFGGGSSKTTTKNEYGKDVQGIQTALTKGIGTGMAPYLADSSVFVAPLNDFLTNYGKGAKDLYGYTSGTNYGGSLPDYASRYAALGDGSDLLSQLGTLERYVPGYSQQAIDAATFDAGDIAKYANPYFQDVADAQERQRTRAYEEAQRDIGDDAAGSAAFGGSGEAIRRSQLDRNLIESAADDTAALRSEAYGQGAQLAQANANALSSALSAEGTSLYNRALGSAQYDDSLNNDAYSRKLQALSGASGYDLSRANYNNQFSNDYVSRNNSALGLMSNFGDYQRGYDQQVGDRPYTQFQRFASFVPSYQPTTTTKTPTQGGGLLGGLLAGAGSLFGI